MSHWSDQYRNDDSNKKTPLDDYVFDENGKYLRTDKTKKPDKLVIENSKTKKKSTIILMIQKRMLLIFYII